MHTHSLRSSLTQKIILKEVLKISSFVFLLSISSRIRVYLPYSPVPITMQTFTVFLSVIFLKRACFHAYAGWIFLGLLGLPVFSKGAGFLYFFTPTAGYILGFLLASLLLIRILFLRKNILWYTFCFSLATMVIYICGLISILVTLRPTFSEAFMIGVVPFLYGDALKIILASLIARQVLLRALFKNSKG